MPTNGANSELLLLSLVWASCKDHTKSTTCKRESGEKEPESNVKTPAEMPTLYICLCVHYKKKTPGLTGEGAPWFGAVLLTQRLRDNDQHKETHKEENSCFKITKIGYFNLMETGMT